MKARAASLALLFASTLVILTRASYDFVTLAGRSGSPGATDGIGAGARFDRPTGLALDVAGNLYVADSGNQLIRQITPSGEVRTLAGDAGNRGSDDGSGTAARFDSPEGIAVDSGGNLFVADMSNHTIRRITPTGVVSTFAGSAGQMGSADGSGSTARFNYPHGLTIDAAGNLFIADSGNSAIRQITPAGIVTTVAGRAGIMGHTNGPVADARFLYPQRIAVDSAGNLYVADSDDSAIRLITRAGVVSTLAGTPGKVGSLDGSGATARMYCPYGLVVDADLSVLVSDSCTLRSITPTGDVTTFAGQIDEPGSVDGIGGGARFVFPDGLVFDAAGNLYVADIADHTIRKGVVSTALSPPMNNSKPGTQNLSAGIGVARATFRTVASGEELNYQWFHDDVPVGGANDESLTVVNLSVADTGTYSVAVSNDAGAIEYVCGSLRVLVPDPNAREPYLANLAGRAKTGVGENTVIIGLVAEESAPGLPTLVRGVGTTLRPFGVSQCLPNSALSVFSRGGVVVAHNDEWSGNTDVVQVATRAGAFPLLDGSNEAALLYTCFGDIATIALENQNQGEGIGLLEVYRLDASDQTANSPALLNLSLRACTASGEGTAIAGFVIVDPQNLGRSLRLVLRAVGPTLSTQGIVHPLADPVLTLYNSEGEILDQNDDWSFAADANPVATAELAAAVKKVGAFDLPIGSKDAALLVDLPTGAYTLHAAGGGGLPASNRVDEGVVLLEIYLVR